MIPIKELEEDTYEYVIIRYRNDPWALVGGKEEDVVRSCKIKEIFDDGKVRINFHDDLGFPQKAIVKNTMLYKTKKEAKDKLKEMLVLEKELQRKMNIKVTIIALVIITAAIFFMLNFK